MLDPDGGEGALCELVSETVGVNCEECGNPNPGVFCLNVAAENVSSEELPGLTLQARSCADIIGTASTCPDEAADYDEDGDGYYEQCPEWSPPIAGR
jgi:hypothetical protein